MARIRRKNLTADFESKHGDLLQILISPPHALTPQFEHDLNLFIQANPDMKRTMYGWREGNAQRLREKEERSRQLVRPTATEL